MFGARFNSFRFRSASSKQLELTLAGAQPSAKFRSQLECVLYSSPTYTLAQGIIIFWQILN